MKRFLKKRWHSIPVGIITAVLVLGLVTGSVFAAYSFFTATAQVEVVEAIAVGAWDTWDNLEPYGAVDDVNILLGESDGNPTITITTLGSGKYVGDGFTAGEFIVIPLNIRNGSDGELDLSASVASDAGGNLILKSSYEENSGPETSVGPEGQSLCYGYEAIESFTPLNNWSATVPGNSGESGSAIVGAKVLFIKIIAPGYAVPGTYNLTVTLARS